MATAAIAAAPAIASIVSGGGKILGGITNFKGSRREADQMQRQGDAVLARGSRGAVAERRQGDIVEGDARAAVAAGGGAMDEGSVENLAKIKSDTDYNSLAALYDAKAERRGIMAQRKETLRAGKRALVSGVAGGVSTLLDGAHSRSVRKKYKGP